MPVWLIVPPTNLLPAPADVERAGVVERAAIGAGGPVDGARRAVDGPPAAVTLPWMFSAAPAPRTRRPAPASVPAVQVITPVTVRSPPPVKVPPSRTRLEADIAALTVDGRRRDAQPAGPGDRRAGRPWGAGVERDVADLEVDRAGVVEGDVDGRWRRRRLPEGAGVGEDRHAAAAGAGHAGVGLDVEDGAGQAVERRAVVEGEVPRRSRWWCRSG